MCTLSRDLSLQPFGGKVLSGDSFSINQGCEHTVVKTCEGSTVALEIRVDFLENDFSSTRVAIIYEGESFIVNEDLSITSKPSFLSKISHHLEIDAVFVTIPEVNLDVTRNLTDVTISFRNNSLLLCGLCGNLRGELVFPDCNETLVTEKDLDSFIKSYKIKPSDQILYEERMECGM